MKPPHNLWPLLNLILCLFTCNGSRIKDRHDAIEAKIDLLKVNYENLVQPVEECLAKSSLFDGTLVRLEQCEENNRLVVEKLASLENEVNLIRDKLDEVITYGKIQPRSGEEGPPLDSRQGHSRPLVDPQRVERRQNKSLPLQPSNVRIFDVTLTSATVSWSFESNGSVNFVIRYKPKAAQQFNPEIVGITLFFYTLRGLTPNVEYEIWVFAANEAGRGAPSAASFTTGEPRIDSPPKNVEARPFDSGSIVVQWEDPEEAERQVTGYKVIYSAEPDLPVRTWNHQVVENMRVTIVGDLQPQLVYTVRVQCLTSRGAGPLSTSVHVKPLKGLPGQPKALRAVATSATTVQLHWNAPHSGETIAEYVIYWNNTQLIHRKSVPGVESFVLEELNPDSLYFMWVAAKSRVGEGPPTLPFPVRTHKAGVAHHPNEAQEDPLVSGDNQIYGEDESTEKRRHKQYLDFLKSEGYIESNEVYNVMMSVDFKHFKGEKTLEDHGKVAQFLEKMLVHVDKGDVVCDVSYNWVYAAPCLAQMVGPAGKVVFYSEDLEGIKEVDKHYRNLIDERKLIIQYDPDFILLLKPLFISNPYDIIISPILDMERLDKLLKKSGKQVSPSGEVIFQRLIHVK